MIVAKNKRCIISSGYVRFYNFWKVFLILIIICCREYSTFQRFSVFLSMLSLPLIACIFGSYKDEKAKSASIHNFLLLGSVVCLMIACTRGNLCALKFAWQLFLALLICAIVINLWYQKAICLNWSRVEYCAGGLVWIH